MVKLIQYDRNTKTRTIFEAEMVQFDEDDIMIKVVINGKEFDEEKIEELRKKGYVYFTYHLGEVLFGVEDYENAIECEKEDCSHGCERGLRDDSKADCSICIDNPDNDPQELIRAKRYYDPSLDNTIFECPNCHLNLSNNKVIEQFRTTHNLNRQTIRCPNCEQEIVFFKVKDE